MSIGHPTRKIGAIALLLAATAVSLPAFGDDTKSRAPIRVAIYADAGAAKTGSPQVKNSLPSDRGFEWKLVSAQEIRSGALKNVDVLIQPGGSGGKQASTLGEEGRDAVKRFVADGGGYIGICAGSYLASANYPWSLNLLDAKVVDTEHWARGTGEVKIGLTKAGKQALGSEQDECAIYYGQGPLLAPAGKDDINDYEELAIFETEIAKHGAPTGVMKGTTEVARCTYGKGRVQCFSPHPEKTPGLEPFLEAAVRWAADAPANSR